MYGYWKPRHPQQILPELTGVECISRFRGSTAWWREIQETPELRDAISFVRANENTIVDFMYTEHPNDLERHVGRFRYVRGIPGHFEYWDLYEVDGQSWKPFAGTISYTVKASGEPADLADLKRLARKEGNRGRSINVPSDNRLTLKLSWHPSGYRYNPDNGKYEGMQRETQEWHQVDPAGTLTEDNQPAAVPDTFWDDLKKEPMRERNPVGARFKCIAVRNTGKPKPKPKISKPSVYKPKISTPMAAQAKIMACTKDKVFNPLYICKDSHCVFYSACLWMEFQSMTKAPKYLAKMSPGWVIAPPGRALAVFSERVRSRSHILPFQLRKLTLDGLFEDIMSQRVNGVYTVIPKPSMHCVVIDANCQLIFDCFQDAPLVLSHENMNKCIGGHTCTGFFEARLWSFK